MSPGIGNRQGKYNIGFRDHLYYCMSTFVVCYEWKHKILNASSGEMVFK